MRSAVEVGTWARKNIQEMSCIVFPQDCVRRSLNVSDGEASPRSPRQHKCIVKIFSSSLKEVTHLFLTAFSKDGAGTGWNRASEQITHSSVAFVRFVIEGNL